MQTGKCSDWFRALVPTRSPAAPTVWSHSWTVRRKRGLPSCRPTSRLAVACGVANCLAPGPGQIETAHVNEFLERVQIGICGGKSN